MSALDLVGIRKRFGAVEALAGIDLEIRAGENIAVLGPSGSGKSTLLRIVSGLEEPDAGAVRLDGTDQARVPPHKRDIAIVFQHFALYPHLSALDNITLGLRYGRGLARGEADKRARAVAEQLMITELLDRRPRAMSGGQRQRVALARALVRRASLVLLDEPLSGIDAQLRLTLRVEIARVLRDAGATTLHVTHDQLDALVMADRIAVVRDGSIQQCGSPDELYQRPANEFVARFVGTPPMNMTPARVSGEGLESPFGRHVATAPGAVTLGIRPEHLHITSDRPWTVRARTVLVEPAGPDRIVHLEVTGQPMAARCAVGEEPAAGTTISVGCHPSAVHVFAADTGERLGTAEEVFVDTRSRAAAQ